MFVARPLCTPLLYILISCPSTQCPHLSQNYARLLYCSLSYITFPIPKLRKNNYLNCLQANEMISTHPYCPKWKMAMFLSTNYTDRIQTILWWFIRTVCMPFIRTSLNLVSKLRHTMIISRTVHTIHSSCCYDWLPFLTTTVRTLSTSTIQNLWEVDHRNTVLLQTCHRSGPAIASSW